MYDEILVPIDGSTGTEGAVVRALDLARISDATVHVLSVVDTSADPPGLAARDRDELRQYSEKRGREATQELQQRASDRGLDTVRTVWRGTPHRMILEYVDENAIDLVVMGTHGQSEQKRRRLGSTTERVITFADVPVLAVRLAEDVPIPEEGYTMYDHVVVPTDGSDAAERAAEHGLTIAERYGADVHVLYVVDTSIYGLEDAPRSIVGLLEEGGRKAVEGVATVARERNLPVTTNILRGVPETEILAYAEGVGADLVTLGTRGRSAGTDHLLGSTTARIVGRTDVPVLTTN
ncbi:universal stress protein (plasmid) [Haloferax sp. S1W]|uniref:universal stress protein n=1 Tax=Haloferax sp. S1W TaxID=3377110 RepID=UPI0037C6453C